MFITDGELTSGYYPLLDSPLRELDALNVVRFVVTEGSNAVDDGLEKIASKPAYDYVFDLTPSARYARYPTQSLASSICFGKISSIIF